MDKGINLPSPDRIGWVASALIGLASVLALTSESHATSYSYTGEPTYADLADRIDGAQLVVRAQVRRQAEVPADRAPGLKPDAARLFVEARVTSLLAGKAPIGEALRYIVDLPRDSRGRPPRLKGADMILFAREVDGRPGELQLVGTDAQMIASDGLEARLRPMLQEFFAPDAPARITRVRDVLWVPGNLVGESETQIFVSTVSDGPALISVIRRPGQAPAWGVSWSELADHHLLPPAQNTMVWYRLACFLPARLPMDSHLSRDPLARDRAEQDYQLVLRSLGDCPRSNG